MKIYIRNMACESCKVVVWDTLKKMKLTPLKVNLGEADIKENMTADQKLKFNAEIKKVGLEIVENKNGILIESIKNCIRKYVNAASPPRLNFSDYLSRELQYDYNYLSNLFTEVEAVTISYYINALKIERAKEMMLLEDLTLSEIAKKLHYSNLSHFSAQFKKTSGLTPSQFKKQKVKKRRTMQELIILIV